MAKETNSIGYEIRQLRQAKGLSLKKLSGLSGVSVSYLSAVERGTRKPALATLTDVASALQVDMQWFFVPQQGNAPLERACIVRRENRRNLSNVYGQSPQELGYYDSLLSSSIGGDFYMGIARYAPKSSHAIRRLHQHEGEEHGCVIQGELEMKLGDEVITLRTGDSYSFDASIPHSARNTTDKEAVLVWAVSPVVIPEAVAIDETTEKPITEPENK